MLYQILFLSLFFLTFAVFVLVRKVTESTGTGRGGESQDLRNRQEQRSSDKNGRDTAENDILEVETNERGYRKRWVLNVQ